MKLGLLGRFVWFRGHSVEGWVNSDILDSLKRIIRSKKNWPVSSKLAQFLSLLPYIRREDFQAKEWWGHQMSMIYQPSMTLFSMWLLRYDKIHVATFYAIVLCGAFSCGYFPYDYFSHVSVFRVATFYLAIIFCFGQLPT